MATHRMRSCMCVCVVYFNGFLCIVVPLSIAQSSRSLVSERYHHQHYYHHRVLVNELINRSIVINIVIDVNHHLRGFCFVFVDRCPETSTCWPISRLAPCKLASVTHMHSSSLFTIHFVYALSVCCVLVYACSGVSRLVFAKLMAPALGKPRTYTHTYFLFMHAPLPSSSSSSRVCVLQLSLSSSMRLKALRKTHSNKSNHGCRNHNISQAIK